MSYKKYAKPSTRLINDMKKDFDVSGYSHAMRDNDIRHIKNSHGDTTSEKYPVTQSDIKAVPYIVENYDKVYYNRHNGNDSIVYVKVSPENILYFVEQATKKYGNENLLINKQMIKTGINDIPSIYLEAINKKEGATKFLADLKKIREEYAQSDVGSPSMGNITHSDTDVKNNFMRGKEKYSGNFSDEAFRREYDYFRNAGRRGDPFEKVNENSEEFITALDEKAKARAYQEGLNERAANAKKVYIYNANGQQIKIPSDGKSYGLVMNEETAKMSPEERKTIFQMSKDLNKKVVIAAGLVDENGNRVSGYVTDKAVFIDPSVENKELWTAAHEFSHEMKKKASKEWKRYQDYITERLIKSGEYEGKFNEFKEMYRGISQDGIHEEIACEFTNTLFDDEKELTEFIKKDRSLAERIKDIWFFILDKLGGKRAQNARLERARRMWARCYAAAAENAESTAGSGEVRYRKMIDRNGNEYWQVDSEKDIFKNLKTISEYEKAAYNYLINMRDKKMILEDIGGKKIGFIRLSAEEFTNSDESKLLKKENPDMFKQKMRMIPSLQDLLLTNSTEWESPDLKNHKFLRKKALGIIEAK